jgi:hypothetical protein
VLPGEPAHPAAEGESTDPRVRHVARSGRQAVLLRRLIERAKERSSLDPGAAPLGIDTNALHRGQVDHQPVLGHGESQDGMAAAAHPDLELVLAGEQDRRRHIAGARAPCDRPRTPVDHRVPDGARHPGVPGRVVVERLPMAGDDAELVVERAGEPVLPAAHGPHERSVMLGQARLVCVRSIGAEVLRDIAPTGRIEADDLGALDILLTDSGVDDVQQSSAGKSLVRVHGIDPLRRARCWGGPSLRLPPADQDLEPLERGAGLIAHAPASSSRAEPRHK